MTQLGNSIPQLRMEYKLRLTKLNSEVSAKQGTMPEADLEKWASDERTKIARDIRLKQGPIPSAVLEVRDWKEYGIGGRTQKNIQARMQKGPAVKNPAKAHADILERTTSSNTKVSDTAIRGARLLKGTGRVFFVVGLGMSVSNIVMAEPGKRAAVAKREAVFAGGSTLGAEVGVAICLGFGFTSGGLGLLGCGLVGGGAGGYAADRLVYPVHPDMAARELEMNGILTSPFLLWPHHADRWAS